MSLALLTEYFGENDIKVFKDETCLAWLQASHICKILGFKNSTEILKYHTNEDERQLLEPINGMKVWFISELGLYGLIFKSKKPEAKAFKKWVCTELLLKINARGAYVSPNITSAQLVALQRELGQLKSARINKLVNQIDNLFLDQKTIGS